MQRSVRLLLLLMSILLSQLPGLEAQQPDARLRQFFGTTVQGRQKWEYAFVRRNMDGNVSVTTPEGETGIGKVPLINVLLEGGEKGWELVQVLNDQGYIFIFKRPKP